MPPRLRSSCPGHPSPARRGPSPLNRLPNFPSLLLLQDLSINTSGPRAGKVPPQQGLQLSLGAPGRQGGQREWVSLSALFQADHSWTVMTGRKSGLLLTLQLCVSTSLICSWGWVAPRPPPPATTTDEEARPSPTASKSQEARLELASLPLLSSSWRCPGQDLGKGYREGESPCFTGWE